MAIEEGDTTLRSSMLRAKIEVKSFTSRSGKLVTALGFVISYRNRREPGLVQQLLNAGGDPNGIVSKPYS